MTKCLNHILLGDFVQKFTNKAQIECLNFLCILTPPQSPSVTEKPSRLQSIGSRGVGHNGNDLAHTHIYTCIYIRGRMTKTSVANFKN